MKCLNCSWRAFGSFFNATCGNPPFPLHRQLPLTLRASNPLLGTPRHFSQSAFRYENKDGAQIISEDTEIDVSEFEPSKKEKRPIKGSEVKTKSKATIDELTSSSKITKTRIKPSPKVTPPPEKPKKKLEPWQVQKSALDAKFAGTTWNPRKRLSPETLEGIRSLHASDPVKFATPVLADQFKVSPEVIRRILKSKWRPTEEEAERRNERWERRGEKIWTHLAEIGTKPPKKWRRMGVGRAPPGEAPKWRHGWERKKVVDDAIPWADGERALQERPIAQRPTPQRAPREEYDESDGPSWKDRIL